MIYLFKNKIMNRIVKLTESNLNKLVKRIIYEQQGLQLPPRDLTGFGPEAYPDRGDISQDANMTRETTLGNTLFNLGSSVINTNSDEFRRALSLFGNNTIGSAIITPGVSAVTFRGEPANGPKNIALGQSRAKNLITALKNALPNLRTEFRTGETVVGRNNIPNSEGANKEQFVKISYTTTSQIKVPQNPGENTKTLIKPYLTGGEIDLVPIPVGKDSVKVCLQITVYRRNIDKLMQNIQLIKRFGTVKQIKCP